MDIVIMSDTHGLHRELEVPLGDLLIHAGDFTMFSKSLREIEDFNEWLGELPHRTKILVPGNHEFFLETDPHGRSLLFNATLLIDEAANVDGLKLYGSPMTPLYGGALGIHRRLTASSTGAEFRWIHTSLSLMARRSEFWTCHPASQSA